jgi:cobalt/nickel transport system permease protein
VSAVTCDARAKLVACIGFSVIVVAIPSHEHIRLAGCAAVLSVVAVAARPGWRELGRRWLDMLPFVLVILAAPLMRAQGGWQQTAGEIAKALIGCSALVLLAATTPPDRLLAGLAGLHCPALVVTLLGVLIRYQELLGDEARRLRRAAEARGLRAWALWHAGGIGRLVGALFLRSHARAERVHLAMLARGHAGVAIHGPPGRIRPVEVVAVAVLLGAALACAVVAR